VRVRVSLLDVTTEAQGDAVRIVLSGELDISTAPRVEEELRRVEDDRPAVIVLDLRELEFMDSSGIRVLVAAHARAGRSGARLFVVRPGQDSAVGKIIEVSGLDAELRLVDDPAEL
jgi:anti-anti-sigma factor